MEHLPALACLIATAALVVGEHKAHLPTRVVSKTVAVLGFLAYAFVLGAWEHGPAGQWVGLALVLSGVGDLCLLSRAKPFFLAGLVAFLLGHVAYIGAFWTLGLSIPMAVITAAPLAFFAWRVWLWLGPHVEALRGPVIAYIVVITLMVVCALSAASALVTSARLGLVLAAVLFFASDLCVARDRFVSPGPDNRTIGLPLYFVAQLLFARFIVLT